MTMANRFLIGMSLLGTYLFGGIWAGTVPTEFLYESNLTFRQYSISTYFAQNDPKKPPDSISTDDADKTQKNVNKPERSTKKKGVGEKTKPVKPFVPSEKIPADQGVDFPYDI